MCTPHFALREAAPTTLPRRPFLIAAALLALLAAAPAPAHAESTAPEASETTASDGALQQILERPSFTLDGHEFDLEELKTFYKARQYRPAWETHAEGNREALKTFLTSVAAFADYHGLSQKAYPTELINRLIASGDEADTVRLELLVTESLLRLGHDLRGDKVELAQLYPGWTFRREPAPVAEGLAKAVDERRVNDFIASLAPTAPAYLNLTHTLKTYRAMAAKGAWPTIAAGPKLVRGDQGPRVSQLRARLVAEGYLPAQAPTEAENELFTETLQETLATYQTRNGLQPDGQAGAKTLAALNTPPQKRIDQIVANMERWRHMPDSTPTRYAEVNIADAMLNVVEDGKSAYHSVVVVGRPDRKTPFIQSQIRSVIFNPSWHVPTKIAQKDILPKLRKDPHYLEKLGFVINGSADDPHGANIDWNKIKASAFNFRLRQAPGDLNSLGRLKFDFDNDFAVYMHGTPHQELFEKPERYYSSGCIRLEDPVQFAKIVLASNDGDWTPERIQAEVDKTNTRWLRIAEPLPLRVVYWTVFEDEDGAINFRHDIYNYDRFLLESLEGGKS